MKNIIKVLSVIFILLALTIPALAADTTVDCKVYYAEDILSNITCTANVKVNLVAANDGNPSYIHAKSSIAADWEYFRFFPVVSDASDADYVPAFKFTDYPVVAIRYKSNIAVKKERFAINAGLLIQHTGKYERCWSLGTEFVNNEKWRKAIIDIRTFDGFNGGSAKANGVAENSGIRYIQFPAWAYATGTNLSNEYIDIAYIGFFKSVSDAENFGGKDEALQTYTLTCLDRDGKKVGTVSAIDGATVTPPDAPVIEYHDFLGWADESGKLLPASFKLYSDMTIRATYQYNEKAYIDGERAKIVSAALAKGLERTDKSFISGYDGFEFRPDNNMTRAEACTVVTRLLVDETTLDNSKTTAFTDLNKNAWYYKYVTYLESIGYLKSYSGEFKPDQKITRAEFVELVYNMGKISGGDKNVSFKDVPADHPRYAVIMAAAKAGLVNGKSADTFDPDGDIKRSEVVKVLCVALGRTPTADSFEDVIVAGFSDISEKHWAYPYVLEAGYKHKSINDPNGNEIWTSVTDTNDYLVKASDGLVDKLNNMFDERVDSIQASKSEWTVAEGGTVWYFSSSEGDNTNDGKSASTPLQSISKLTRMQAGKEIKAGDVVLFKRGDEWHDKLTCLEGVTYSAYGEGAKPRILGSVEADKPSNWTETDIPGVYQYVYTLTAMKDVGQIIFNDGEAYGMRVLKDSKSDNTLTAGFDNMVSNGITVWHQPVRPFNGVNTLAEIAADIPESDLMFYHDHSKNKLYLYSRNGNPAERFESIELCTYGHTVTAKSNVTIDNLCILYTGSHGVGAGSCKNLTVRNCEIGWIGGSLQDPTNPKIHTRYGNAIEIFGSADGFYVYDNYIYNCFDCGPTVQWQGNVADGQILVQKDIAFYGNALNAAPLEVWLSAYNAATPTSYAILENCRMYDNFVTGSGTFYKNHYKNEPCAFYGGIPTNAIYRECYMEGNYFWGNLVHIIKASPTTTKDDAGFKWVGNVIVHPLDEGSIGYLADDSYNAKGENTQYFFDKNTINELVKNGTLGLNKFYYTPGDKANRRYFQDGVVTKFKG